MLQAYDAMGRLFIGAAVVLAVMIAAGLVGAFLDAILERWRKRIRAAEARRIGGDLVNASWWFRDHSTRVAVQVLGERLAGGFPVDPANAREDWEKRIRRDNAEAS